MFVEKDSTQVSKKTNDPNQSSPAIDASADPVESEGSRESQLPEARAWLAAIIDSSDDAIVSKTLKGVITSWNRAAERMFGYSAPEAVGRSITLIIPPERLHEEVEVMQKIHSGELIDHFETMRLTKDGRLIEISLTVSPIRAADGRIIGASKIARDISDRRRIERERDAALLESQAANRSKDVFLAMLGHELRNPLNAITTGVRLLDDIGSHEPAAVRAREVITRQTQTLTKLVNDMLDVGRVVIGKLALELEAFDLGTAVQSGLSMLSGGGRFANHALQTDISSVGVLADRVRIQQIIENLVSNALKYTPAGGWIRVTVTREGEAAVLNVTDSGVGMPPELCVRVFDLFVQGEDILERSQGGLGIGLTLVRRLTELHGGSVEAFSEGPGRGSRFSVRLPEQPVPPEVAGQDKTTVLAIAAHPDRRGQRGCPRDATRRSVPRRPRGPRSAKRTRGRGIGTAFATGRHARGHRLATARWLRGRAAHTRRPRGYRTLLDRVDRIRLDDRSGARSGSWLRPPPHQTSRPERAGSALSNRKARIEKPAKVLKPSEPFDSRSRKTPPRSFAGALGFDLPVSRRRRRRKPSEQPAGHPRHLLDRVVEGGLIAARGSRHTADFANVLECGALDLFLGRRRLEIEQSADVSAHRVSIAARPRSRLQSERRAITADDSRQRQIPAQPP